MRSEELTAVKAEVEQLTQEVRTISEELATLEEEEKEEDLDKKKDDDSDKKKIQQQKKIRMKNGTVRRTTFGYLSIYRRSSFYKRSYIY